MRLPAWRVIVTRPRFEKQVARRLADLGIEHYLPLRKELRQWHDRRKWVEAPLFSSYLFVKIPDAVQNRVFDAPGVLRYLRDNDRPARLSESEIERVRHICRFPGKIVVTAREGSIESREITVPNGEFAGYKGVLTERNGKQYLKITMWGISQNIFLQVDAEDPVEA